MAIHTETGDPPRRAKRKGKPKHFSDTYAVLDSFGLRKEAVNGGNYRLYFIDEQPFFYVRSWCVYIDFAHNDLQELLAKIRGVTPNAKGSSLNHKFTHFKLRREVVNKKNGATRNEHEGWGFSFSNVDAFTAFVTICTVFKRNGLLTAEEAALEYEVKSTPTTGKERLQESRVGQQKFKKDLLKYWRTCAVTGCSLIAVLKASHIKPWTEATPVEKLDLFNGLLLSPNLDSLFDLGLISFSTDGTILISPLLSDKECLSLGVSKDMRLRKLNGAHEKYLAQHRSSTFKATPQRALT